MPFFKAVLLFLVGLTAFSGNKALASTPSPQPLIQGVIVVQSASPTFNPNPTSKPTYTPNPTPVADTFLDYQHQLFNALNSYRKDHGVAILNWNDNLSNFAQSRSDHLQALGALDDHAGFTDFINNQDGFAKLGFWELGENQSFSKPMPSAHDLIYSQYASSPAHNKNQLNTDWTDVGVGVSGEYTDIVFGGKKR